ALDLYVDTTNEQIYAKPGPGRVHLGSFVKEDAAKAAAADKTATTGDSAPAKTVDIAAGNTNAADLTAVRKEIELKPKMMGARLASDIASLEERVKETENVHIQFTDSAPHFASKNGNFTFAINGRMQAGSQYNFINEVLPATGSNLPNEWNSGATLRRARLG